MRETGGTRSVLEFDGVRNSGSTSTILRGQASILTTRSLSLASALSANVWRTTDLRSCGARRCSLKSCCLICTGNDKSMSALTKPATKPKERATARPDLIRVVSIRSVNMQRTS